MENRLIILLLVCLSNFAAAQESFTLEQAIAYAIEHSDQLAIDALDVENAAASVKEFKSIGLPKINGSINYQYNFLKVISPVPDFISPSVYGVLFQEQLLAERDLGEPEIFELTFQTNHSLIGGLDASWLLFDGSYLVGLRGARLFKDLTSKASAITIQEIKANVTKAYMNTLILDENASIINDNLENIVNLRNETQAFYENGFVEQIDVSRIDLTVENLLTEKEKIKQLQEINYNLLKFQMNYPMEEEINTSEDLETLVNLFRIQEVNIDKAIDYNLRAEYEQIELGQKLNELDKERIQKAYLPSLTSRLGVAGSLQRNNLFDGAEAGLIPNAFAAISLNIPIYDGNEKKAQIQQREITIEKADIEKTQFEKGVELQIRNSKLLYLNAKRSLDNAIRGLEITNDIYNKTLIKYKEGVGSSLEITQAESSLFEAQGKYINALYDLLIAKTDIEIAQGTL
jgi:outer membrane protein TolC